MLITDQIELNASRQPHKVAIVTEFEQVTYAQLQQQMLRVAQSIHRRQYERVALLVQNRVHFIELFLGIIMAGRIVIPFDPKWSAQEVRSRLERCQADVFVVDAPTTVSIKDDVPEHIKVVPDLREFNSPNEDQMNRCLSDLDSFYLGFTSGTTGNPKGFLRSHRSWVSSFQACDIEFGIRDSDHVLIPGPLEHSLFLFGALHALHTGATCHVMNTFNSGQLLKRLKEEKISVMYAVPTMIAGLLKAVVEGTHYDTQENATQKNDLRQVIVSGSKWENRSKAKFATIFPRTDIYEFYGASELSFVSVLGPVGNHTHPDSVGRPFTHVQVSIRDSQGNEVKQGQTGQLFVKSEFLFSGYEGNETETRQVIQGEWASVGDLATQDDEGYLYLVGRKQNMVITGGLNVYPEEVEKVLLQHTDVQEVVVLGVPDDYWGEKVVAALIVKDTAKTLHLKAYCREILANYKCPKHFINLASLPYTSSGKIDRAQVKQIVFKHEEVIACPKP